MKASLGHAVKLEDDNQNKSARDVEGVFLDMLVAPYADSIPAEHVAMLQEMWGWKGVVVDGATCK